ncbi:MAG: DUF1684 domain-containing protein [Thermomicrobiales bacterium]|nr:DUF1684 domain-containing protein [Thermomicrobiales bacterium]
MSRLDDFRARKNDLFKSSDQSPLDSVQREQFSALAYFPENADLALTLPMDRSAAGTDIVLDTSDGQQRQYRRVGTIEVPVRGEPARFTLFAMPGHTRLFLPFMDGTTGVESYKGGRYLEPRERPDGQVEVDFNYAYNPYCAYGDGWSCPIPPEENRVTPRIEAGEQEFKG